MQEPSRFGVPLCRVKLFVAVLLTACPLADAWAQGGPPGPPPAVGVASVTKQEITETASFVGRVQAIDRVDLVSRVTAFVDQRLFTEGTEVAAGDVLYKLESAPFEASLAQATASAAQYNATLSNATTTLARATSLLNTPAGQRSTVDDARASQLSTAAQLAGAQAQMRTAQINLDYATIRAPIAGKIGLTNFSVGNVVSPSAGALATIVSQDPIYVIFPIAVRSWLDLEKRYASKGGMSAVVVKLALPDGTAYPQGGKIDFVDPSVSANTDTLVIRAKIANPAREAAVEGKPVDRPLVDGEFVTVSVEGIDKVEALGIPRAAVLADQQGSYVLVVGDDDVAQQRRITLGQSTPATAIVASGLKEGESVIVDGLQRVRPGSKVAPGPAAAPPAAAPKG